MKYINNDNNFSSAYCNECEVTHYYNAIHYTETQSICSGMLKVLCENVTALTYDTASPYIKQLIDTYLNSRANKAIRSMFDGYMEYLEIHNKHKNSDISLLDHCDSSEEVRYNG